MMNRLIFSCITLLSLCACNKNNDSGYNKNVNSELTIEFDNIAGTEDLKLNTDYTNTANEQFSVSALKYVVGNLILTDADGATFTVPGDSAVFSVDEADVESQEVNLEVPEGEYTTLEFSVRFFQMQGSSDAATGPLDYETGSPDGSSNVKTITLDLSQRGTAKVKWGRHSEVHLMLDVINLFKDFTIADQQQLTDDELKGLIGNNLSGMIRHDHTHN